jgi:hypothetical protein
LWRFGLRPAESIARAFVSRGRQRVKPGRLPEPNDAQPITAARVSASTLVGDPRRRDVQRLAATALVDDPVKRAAVRSSPGLRPEKRLRTPPSA